MGWVNLEEKTWVNLEEKWWVNLKRKDWVSLSDFSTESNQCQNYYDILFHLPSF